MQPLITLDPPWTSKQVDRWASYIVRKTERRLRLTREDTTIYEEDKRFKERRFSCVVEMLEGGKEYTLNCIFRNNGGIERVSTLEVRLLDLEKKDPEKKVLLGKEEELRKRIEEEEALRRRIEKEEVLIERIRGYTREYIKTIGQRH